MKSSWIATQQPPVCWLASWRFAWEGGWIPMNIPLNPKTTIEIPWTITICCWLNAMKICRPRLRHVFQVTAIDVVPGDDTVRESGRLGDWGSWGDGGMGGWETQHLDLIEFGYKIGMSHAVSMFFLWGFTRLLLWKWNIWNQQCQNSMCQNNLAIDSLLLLFPFI